MPSPPAADSTASLKTRRWSGVAALSDVGAYKPTAYRPRLPRRESADSGHLIHQLTRRIARLERRLRHAHVDSIMALVGAVEAKDPYTRHHSLNVSLNADALACALRLTAREREDVRIAAILHDIGKIGLPDHILTKPGPLTHVEFDLMKEHSVIGAAILQPIAFFSRIRPLVLHHHEWFDGRGYPAGLRGEHIPLGARILHVADAIDAMASPRSYKQPYPLERQIEQLVSGRGRQFDPDVADAAVAWLQSSPRPVLH
jgi:putative nucleotidyltransferase with HDIG domain